MNAVARMSAEDRKEAVVAAAAQAFASAGYEATSTEEIARLAGISQPYIFRLFGSKRELFVAAVERCFERILDAFEQASRGMTGPEALHAMGMAYQDLISDPTVLRLQLHSFAASTDDPEIRSVVQRGFGQISDLARTRSGAGAEEFRSFFATGMLCTVIAATGLDRLDQPWARALVPAGEVPEE